MKIKDLRTLVNGLDSSLDDAEIVVESTDHSYRHASAAVVTAEYSKGRCLEYFNEYFDDENMSAGSTKIKVLLVG